VSVTELSDAVNAGITNRPRDVDLRDAPQLTLWSTGFFACLFVCLFIGWLDGWMVFKGKRQLLHISRLLTAKRNNLQRILITGGIRYWEGTL
jgi:hypothetical protein